MSKNKILIYGSAGYMGKLLTKYAQEHNLPIILGARQNFSTSFPTRIFSLDEETKIIEQLHDIKLVINLAGPFINTNKQLVQACIKSQTHYIDIAGEAPEFESLYQYNQAAIEANIMIMPGAGFGVVPTDIVANLAKQKLPNASHLKIAYITEGGASRGTLKTVLKDINKAGLILKNGYYEIATPAFKKIDLNVAGQKFNLVYNPWRADLYTARLSTSISNIETYANFPGFVVRMMQGKLLWLRDLILNRLINLIPEGPSTKQLEKGRTICHAIVSNSQGQSESATIIGPEAYLFTAETLITISKRIVLDADFKVGYQTPNIYGKALLDSIPSVQIL